MQGFLCLNSSGPTFRPCCVVRHVSGRFILLKPTGYVMHQQV